MNNLENPIHDKPALAALAERRHSPKRQQGVNPIEPTLLLQLACSVTQLDTQTL